MRFAICNELFQDRSLEAGFRTAAQCGYTGLELAPFTLGDRPIDARRIRLAAENEGLSIVGLHWLLAKTRGFHLTSPDAEVRERTTTYLAELATLCAELGGSVLVFGSPQQRSLHPEITRELADAYAEEIVASLIPTLETTGTVLALEPLSPTETNFWNSADEVTRFLQKFNSPRVRLHLDCKAMASENRPIPEIIREFAPWTAHFHANDPNLRGPGFGELDFTPIFRTLRDTGYQGWISVEVFDYTPGPDQLAAQSLRYMRSVEEKVGPDDRSVL